MPATNAAPICLSLGMMAWNEEDSIRPTLESLFQQTIFERLARRGERCEILVLANGCTDRTVAVAQEICTRMEQTHPWAAGFAARVIDTPEAGRNNAWNRHFWQLFPGLVTFRFRRLWKLRGLKRLTHLPAACAGFVVTMLACARAHRALRNGTTQYWPKPMRETILSLPKVGAK
jgi:hypothetical protein